MKTAKTGDVILIDYTAEAGTQITINGVSKATIPGVEFNRALLSVWFGRNPAGTDLKKSMLGG